MGVIDEYILEQKEEVKEILQKAKEVIANVLPEYQETLGYGMPTFKDKKNIIHFAATKNHLGIYPGPRTIEAFSDRLKNFKTSKGAVQFPYSKEIPYELISEMAIFSYKSQK